MSNLKDFLVVSDEVKEALEQNKPVVALESTIILTVCLPTER